MLGLLGAGLRLHHDDVVGERPRRLREGFLEDLGQLLLPAGNPGRVVLAHHLLGIAHEFGNIQHGDARPFQQHPRKRVPAPRRLSLRRHRAEMAFLSSVVCVPKISGPASRLRRRMICWSHGGSHVLTGVPVFVVRITTSPFSFMRLLLNVDTSLMRSPVYVETLMKSLRSLPVTRNLYSC